ncbi:MAG: anthranilate synthase component I [Terriglobia bacterium]
MVPDAPLKMIYPNFEKFVDLTKQGNIIPVYKAVSADLLTPVSAYLRIEAEKPYAFLLESVEGGEKIARFSFLGCDPYLILSSTGELVEIIRGKEILKRKGHLLDVMKKITERYQPVKQPGLPPFVGGAVGYFAYETIRWVEDIPQRGEDDLQLEDAVLMFFSNLLVFDHVRQQILIVSNVFVDENADQLEEKYQMALFEIETLEARLKQQVPVPPFGAVENGDETVKSNFSKADYLKAVEKCKEWIKIGDIFQVVLSQRFTVSVTTSSFNIYRALRMVNPSPYMFYLKLKDHSVIGSSPEMLVKITDGTIHYRPIAGTRPRGDNEDEDALLAEELKADEKERAEHIMLVDLGRNDLGKVCEFGSVEVVDLMFIEKYSHVMHLVSSLRGKLKPGVDRFEALMSCFPAGTVTGAPKVRAMQIIDELEPTRRAVYAGAILYLDFSGNLDSCIAIRTLVVKDGKAYIQAGGGIVADSMPEKEFQETINKSRALIKAVEMAEGGF